MFPFGVCHRPAALEVESAVSLSHDGADSRGPILAAPVWVSGWCWDHTEGQPGCITSQGQVVIKGLEGGGYQGLQ